MMLKYVEMDLKTIKEKVRKQEYDLSLHAHQERQEEQVSIEEIEKAILTGDIIEQYPDDPRGTSCLIAGKAQGRPLHLVCGFRGKRLLIVTVYRPKALIWKDYKTRARRLKSRV